MVGINLKFLAVLVVIGCMMTTVALVQENKELRQQRADITGFAKLRDAQVKYYQNELGNQVAKVEAIQLENRNLRELANTKDLEYLKQFDGLKKSLKNLENAVNTNLKITTKVEGKLNDSTFTVLNGKDTTYVLGKTFKLEDNYRKLSIAIVDRNITVDETMIVPLSIVTYWERKKILWLKIGKKHYTTEATSENPHVKIDKIQAISKRR